MEEFNEKYAQPNFEINSKSWTCSVKIQVLYLHGKHFFNNVCMIRTDCRGAINNQSLMHWLQIVQINYETQVFFHTYLNIHLIYFYILKELFLKFLSSSSLLKG